MLDIINKWFRENFSDPQAVYLVFTLVVGFSIVIFLGEMLLPVFAGVVIAYLLDSLVERLTGWHIPRWLAVQLAFFLFMLIFMTMFFGLVPLLARQVAEFIQQMPDMILRGQKILLALPDVYPYISEDQVRGLMQTIASEAGTLGQKIVSQTISSLSDVITIVVYLVLMPLLVFFFLKDKQRILEWFGDFLPDQRALLVSVWHDMDAQLGNYVRGKFWEIIIVGVVSAIAFSLLELQYAILLAALVGLSVLIPYVGAVAVTVPVVLVAFFQWGWTAPFAWLVIAYLVIQALDGTILVPLMFSEVVNLHPIAIIVAVLVFGGFWGFWGVFFAIPLATLVQALLSAWPGSKKDDSTASADTA